MNIIIPPKVVAFLRNSVAFAIAIYISYAIGTYTGTDNMMGVYLSFFQFFYLPWLVMIATKREMFLGFLTAALTAGHFAVLQYLIDRQNDPSKPGSLWESVGTFASMWLITFVLSLIVTVPIARWRQWRRQQKAAAESVAQRLQIIEEIGAGEWPPAPKSLPSDEKP